MVENNKVLEIEDFIYLMLAMLARDSKIINMYDSSKKYACIPCGV